MFPWPHLKGRMTANGDSQAFLVWNRIIMPNGRSLRLGGMEATVAAGECTSDGGQVGCLKGLAPHQLHTPGASRLRALDETLGAAARHPRQAG